MLTVPILLLSRSMLRAQKPYLFLLEICISLFLKHISRILIFRLFRLELEILIGTIGLSYPAIDGCIGRSIHSLSGEGAG